MAGRSARSDSSPSRRHGDGSIERVARVAFVAILGAWLVPSRGDEGLFHDGAPNIASAIAIGMAITLGLLAVSGTVVFLLRGPPASGRGWFQAVSGNLAAALTLALIVGGAVLWQATLPRQQTHRGASEAAGHSARTAAALRWSDELIPLIRQLRRPWIKARAFDARVAKARNPPGLRSMARRERQALSAVLQRMRNLPPSPLARLRRARHSLERVVAVRVRAFDAYLRALRRNARHGVPLALDREDRLLLARGRALSHRARTLGLALGPQLFGVERLFSGA